SIVRLPRPTRSAALGSGGGGVDSPSPPPPHAATKHASSAAMLLFWSMSAPPGYAFLGPDDRHLTAHAESHGCGIFEAETQVRRSPDYPLGWSRTIGV